jgi:hypothetical protein
MLRAATILRFANSSSIKTNLSAGMNPRVRQLETAALVTLATAATAVLPPSAEMSSSTEPIMDGDYSQNVSVSSDHGVGLGLPADNAHDGAMPKTKRKLLVQRDGAPGRPFAEIGARLLKTREALELDRKELCEIIDCSPTRWSQYETGVRCITIEIALRLADTYDISLDWVYRGKLGQLPAALLAKMAAPKQR